MGDASHGEHPALSGVSTGYPGEGGWLHTRYAPVRHSQSPEGDFTVRLACIRPAASVHPEPGSNSSLYYCLACFSLNLGFPPLGRIAAPAVFLTRFLFSGIPQDACAGLRLSKNFLLNPFHNLAFPSRLAGAKVLLFWLRATLFLLFLKYFYIYLIISV